MNIHSKNTKSKILYTFTALTAFFLYSNNAEAQLTGSIRQNFTGSLNKNCYETQRAASVNQNASNDALQKYCSCMATTVADTLSNTYVSEMEKGNIPVSNLTPIMNQAANYCTRKLNPNSFK